jgi:N-acetylglucosaminyl-diphospho-decaprenol L-rhamnosyltransferase
MNADALRSVPAPTTLTAGDTPEILVIAVTYNSAGDVEAFLSALPAALEGVETARVIVVDNASEDGTGDLVRRMAPWAEVVDAGDNLGYAAAINVAMLRAMPRGGYLVVNPDAVPSAGSARALRAATTTGDVGAAVPRVLDTAGRLKHSMRREPTLVRAMAEAALGGRKLARRFGEVVRDDDAYVAGASPDWATGAAIFVTRRAADEVGPWDERFFLYSEETDYALRLRDAGYRISYVPAATVVHPGGAMSRSPWLWSLVVVNRTRLYAKRHGRVGKAAFWLVVLANEALRSLRDRPTHRAALRALLEVGPRRALDASSTVSTRDLLTSAARPPQPPPASGVDTR